MRTFFVLVSLAWLTIPSLADDSEKTPPITRGRSRDPLLEMEFNPPPYKPDFSKLPPLFEQGSPCGNKVVAMYAAPRDALMRVETRPIEDGDSMVREFLPPR